MDPASATEADLTYLLQYLKSADIPADEETSCAHTVAQFQAQTALDFLTRILESNPSSLTVRRIIQAWPDIDKWIDYTFHEWVRGGKFTARKNWGRVNGFNTIIPFLAAVAKVPEVADLLVADSRRTSIFEILAFCWNIEADEWFVKEKRYDPSITAAYPFCALAMTRVHFTLDLLFREEPSADTIMSFPGLDFMKIFESVRDGLGRTSADTARTAIALLASNNRVPLRTLDAHIDILGTLDPIAGCTDALPAQHCVRHMTRVLSDLMQKPYDADCAPQMTRCISMCIHYLVQNVPTKDGYSNARMAVLAGVLPALLRSQSWLAPGGSGGYENAVKLFQLIGLYIVYPSVLRPLLVAARKIDELGIVDPTQPFGQLYNNLMHLVADRLALVRPVDDRHIDLSVKCNNATCGKHDTDGTFKSCSGCFMTSYCSEDCQKAAWVEEHEGYCGLVRERREAGEPLPTLPEDFAYLFQFTMAHVDRNRAEIVRIWEEEQPTRTPLISFDFSQDPNGVMIVGERCLEMPPGNTAETGMLVPALDTVMDAALYFNFRWREAMTRPGHDEDALVCVFLPQGQYPLGNWMFIGPAEESEGTVLERLIQRVDGGLKYGARPPVS